MKLTTKIIADKVNEISNCDIREDSRLRINVRSRFIYAKLCNELLFDTITNIGKEIGKDHSTVLYYLKQAYNDHIFVGDLEYNYDLIKTSLFGDDIDVTDKHLKEVREEYRSLNSKFTVLTKNHLDLTEDYRLLKSDYHRLLLINLKLKKNKKNTIN